MQIECTACKKSFVIDDAKVPAGSFAVKCPSCKEKIAVRGPGAPKEPQPQAPPPVPEGTKAAEGTLAPGSKSWERLVRDVSREVLRNMGVAHLAHGSMDGEEDFERERTALVCEAEPSSFETIASTLRKMGYAVHHADMSQKGVEMIQKNPYALATIDIQFPDDSEGGYKILQAANGLLSARRRDLFAAIVSADLATMDMNSAFILGANLTVSKNDLERLGAILTKAVQEHEKKYQIFHQVEDELEEQQQRMA